MHLYTAKDNITTGLYKCQDHLLDKDLLVNRLQTNIMPGDPYVKRLLYFVFVGSKGGINRIRLISYIRERPLNANQLAKEMGLDYKAIQHHIGVLEKNNLITKVGDKYGANFFISTFLEVNLDAFDEMVAKLEKSK